MSQNQNAAMKFANWKVGESYQLEKILGHGSYGEVALAIHRETGKKCAVKLMRDVFDIPVDAKRAYREIHILRHLKHVNIISLNEVISPLTDEVSAGFKKLPLKDLADLYLVFDFVDTDLSKIFRSDQYMGTGHVKYILYQLLLGLKYLHSANVIHRDIKPANILISCSDCSLKIADFGLSRVIGSEDMSRRRDDHITETKQNLINEEKRDRATYSLQSAASEKNLPKSIGLGPPDLLGPAMSDTTMDSVERPSLRRQLTHHVITRWYRAPEVILSQYYDSEVDIWSIGCIFAELLGMIKENIPNYKDRRPLFPGESCGELSADDSSFDQTFHEGDQLSTILDVLGTPSDTDIRSFPPNVSNIIRNFGKRTPVDFCRKFPATDQDGHSLLRAMLAFDPSKRITIDDALHHPFLSAEQSDRREREALCRDPMSADIELVSEDPDNLFENIIREVSYYKQLRKKQHFK